MSERMGAPEKPSLDGLEDKWAARWDADGTYRVRPVEDARRRVRDRHAAAHGEWVAARGARVLVHAHRHHRPLPAHARSRGLLPDGMGRQRCPDRAPGAELLRRPVRSVPAVRPGLRAAGEAGQAGDPDQPPELRGAVRPARGGGRAEVRGALAHARASRSTGRPPTRPSASAPGGRRSARSCATWPGARRTSRRRRHSGTSTSAWRCRRPSSRTGSCRAPTTRSASAAPTASPTS